MSRQFWTDFLELYISFPCLWKFSDASYGNKNSRAAAMQTLLEKLHEVEPLADIKTLSRKINSFRTTFRQVYKKYYRPISSEGGASKDVEEPTLWYFNILLPTVVGQGSARHNKSRLDDSCIYDRFNNSEEPESRHSSSVYAMKPQSKDSFDTLVSCSRLQYNVQCRPFSVIVVLEYAPSCKSYIISDCVVEQFVWSSLNLLS